MTKTKTKPQSQEKKKHKTHHVFQKIYKSTNPREAPKTPKQKSIGEQ